MQVKYPLNKVPMLHTDKVVIVHPVYAQVSTWLRLINFKMNGIDLKITRRNKSVRITKPKWV